jgi:hypothetical protein
MMASLQGLLLFTLLHVTLFFEEVSTLNCACCFYLKNYFLNISKYKKI